MGKIIQVTPQMKQAVKEIMNLAKGSRDYFGVKSYLDGYDLSAMKTSDTEQIQRLMDNIEYIVEDTRIRSRIVILTDHIRGMTRREEARMPQKTHRNNIVTSSCGEESNEFAFIEKTLMEARYFAKSIREYLFEIEQQRPLTNREKEIWEKTHDVHVHTNDAGMMIQNFQKEAIESLKEQERECEPELE